MIVMGWGRGEAPPPPPSPVVILNDAEYSGSTLSQFTLGNEGTAYGSTTAVSGPLNYDWLTNGDVADYQAKFQPTSGSVSGSSTNSWLSLSSTRNWKRSSSTAGTSIGTLSIRLAAAPNTVLATATIKLKTTSTVSPLSASRSPSSASGTGSTSTVTSSSATCTASGGTGGYSYSWAKVSGDTITAVSSSSATTTFRATSLNSSGETRTASFRCTVTDSAGSTATTSTVSVTITRTASGGTTVTYTPSAGSYSYNSGGNTGGVTIFASEAVTWTATANRAGAIITPASGSSASSIALAYQNAVFSTCTFTVSATTSGGVTSNWQIGITVAGGF